MEQQQVTFSHLDDESPQARAWINERMVKLGRLHPSITHCRVVVDVPHRHHSKGRRYLVKVEVAIPGSELVGHNHLENPHSDSLLAAIAEAFHACERQLDAQPR